MTKYFCDKCNSEIIGDIYHVKIYVEPTKTKSYWETLGDVLSPYTKSTNKLNEVTIDRPMYCQKCKEKIENFITCGL